MVPASKTAGISFPAWWQANDTPGMTPNILDGRQGGVPDPAPRKEERMMVSVAPPTAMPLPPTRDIRILLADDHQLLRQGVRKLLESEPAFRLVGEAGDGLEVLQKVERLHPDVLVLDLMMPGLNGLEVTRQVHRRWPRLKIVICHCGGALNRFIPKDHHIAQKDFSKNLFYDCCAYDDNFLTAAIKQRGVDQMMFGTEFPGSGGAVREDGRPSDDVLPTIRPSSAATSRTASAWPRGTSSARWRSPSTA